MTDLLLTVLVSLAIGAAVVVAVLWLIEAVRRRRGKRPDLTRRIVGGDAADRALEGTLASFYHGVTLADIQDVQRLVRQADADGVRAPWGAKMRSEDYAPRQTDAEVVDDLLRSLAPRRSES